MSLSQLQELIKEGFTKEEALQALNLSNNNSNNNSNNISNDDNKNQNDPTDYVQFNLIVSHLMQYPTVLKLCKTVLSNIVKDPTNPKYQSLNDAKLASKCSSNSYVYLSQFLKYISFFRQTVKGSDQSECRWIFNNNNDNNIIMSKYLLILKQQLSKLNKQIVLHSRGQSYPPNMGILQTNKVKLWAKGIQSVNNFWNRGTNWGNYYVILIFVNCLSYQVSIHWINQCGIERKKGVLLNPGQTTSIFSQLSHPHVIKKLANPMYGNSDEYILGYNATARGISNNGCHVIYIGGKIHPNNLQKRSLELIKNAPKDNRDPPPTTPAPNPPRPEDRRGLFWGGR